MVDRYAAESWDGTTVFQVKHKATLGQPAKDAAWVWEQIRSELDEWSNPDTKRQQVPRYFVFVTNVPLTPTQGSGGFDILTARVQGYVGALNDSSAEDHLGGYAKVQARREREARRDRMRSLRKWRIWDGYQIDGLLDAHEGVRRAFDGFLTAGDVLADLSKLSTSLTEQELGPALKAHARWALIKRAEHLLRRGRIDSSSHCAIGRCKPLSGACHAGVRPESRCLGRGSRHSRPRRGCAVIDR